MMPIVEQDPYAEYRRIALEAGADPAECEAAIAEMRRERACVAEGVCPKCGSEVTREVDRSQHGPTSVPGVWVSYRCHDGCRKLLLDLVEQGEGGGG